MIDPLRCITPCTQNQTLLKACKEGKEDTVEKLLKLPRPELNVACVDEAGLSPLHYAVLNKLISSLPMMVQHPTFTLAVADKVSLACMCVYTYVCMYVQCVCVCVRACVHACMCACVRDFCTYVLYVCLSLV